MPQDDDDSLLPCSPDAEIDDETPWVELPEIASTPCALVAGPYQALPEDMDVFANEDWPEDGMWGLHGADTSLGEREFDAQSDESLISASFPSASVITRSPQACSFALYHHLDDDYHKQSRYNHSQLAFLEDSGTSNLTHSLPSHAPHDHHYSEKHEQLMQELGTCQVGPESFGTLDSCSEREEDSDPILFDLDIDECPNAADLLDWD